MYALPALYARPYRAQEPVVCVDEKSKQPLQQTRAALATRPGAIAREDCEYRRAGTGNIFMAVEPKGRHREVAVTARRTKPDFVAFVQRLVEEVYAQARKIHLVLDNLNTHFRSSFEEVLGVSADRRLLRRVQFHYTPKHASRLNMAEIEIGIMERQCTRQRIGTAARLRSGVAAWQRRRNRAACGIQWQFTRQDAGRKLSHHYVT